MIGERINETREVVCLHDPAVAGHPDTEAINKYRETRDISIINNLTFVEPPTRFFLKPLKTVHIDHKQNTTYLVTVYLDRVVDGPPYLGEDAWSQTNNSIGRFLKDEALNKMPTTFVEELGYLIVAFSEKGDIDSPFTFTLGGWLDTRRYLSARRAMAAFETATPESSE